MLRISAQTSFHVLSLPCWTAANVADKESSIALMSDSVLIVSSRSEIQRQGCKRLRSLAINAHVSGYRRSTFETIEKMTNNSAPIVQTCAMMTTRASALPPP